MSRFECWIAEALIPPSRFLPWSELISVKTLSRTRAESCSLAPLELFVAKWRHNLGSRFCSATCVG